MPWVKLVLDFQVRIGPCALCETVRAWRPYFGGPSGCLAVLESGGNPLEFAARRQSRILIRQLLRSPALQKGSPDAYRLAQRGILGLVYFVNHGTKCLADSNIMLAIRLRKIADVPAISSASTGCSFTHSLIVTKRVFLIRESSRSKVETKPDGTCLEDTRVLQAGHSFGR